MTQLTFGQKLMILRRNKKLSQKKLAEVLKIGSANVARYESDLRSPHLKILITISDFFGVPVDYLVKDSEDIMVIDDKELLRLAAKTDKLPSQDKDFIKTTIQSYLQSHSAA